MVSNPQVSAGVLVTVTDESIYATPSPTSVPLVFIATRANKITPDGRSTAPGTIESNVLRRVTSQRRVNQAYGNAVFPTRDGEPIYGDETAEMGLAALWRFLGVARQAYVVRADIDLAQLVPRSAEPVLPPPNRTYWINSAAVVGGIFQYNGRSWAAVPFDLFTHTPGRSDGSDGDWCFDYRTLDGTIRFRDGGTWFAATSANLTAHFGRSGSLFVGPTAPQSPTGGNFWYKTTSRGGGTNLALRMYRAVDGVFVIQAIIRQTTPPTPNQGTIWEDTSNIRRTGARPLYVGTGAAFIQLPVLVQPNQPVRNPATGTLWYNDDYTDFALAVEGTGLGFGNQWVPITTTTVRNPRSVQKVIRARQPRFPQEGRIWVDVRTPENLDYFPVIKRYTRGRYIDITASVLIQDQDPGATVVADGTYWLNLGDRLTRYTVKRYDPNYTPVTVVEQNGSYVVVNQTGNNWSPDAGAVFGRLAQREMVVQSLRRAIASNDAIRSEVNYYQLMAVPGYPELYPDMVGLNRDINNISFGVADTPKFMIPRGIRTGREVTLAEWIRNANNVTRTGEQGFRSAYSPYMGFWYPWCLATNVDGLTVFVPPSHMTLRAIAKSDAMTAPWWPPAGYTRGQVDNAQSVGYLDNDGDYVPLQMNRGQRDIAYSNQINPISYIPNRGLIIMGQKTMNGVARALDRVNVARLIAKMAYDLQRLFEPFLFELNDPTTWASVRIVGNRYLAGLASLRALYDYALQCNDQNNTPTTIDEYQLWVDVAIQPEKRIEFIYVPIQVLSTGSSLPF